MPSEQLHTLGVSPIARRKPLRILTAFSSVIVVKKMKQRREKKLFAGFHFTLCDIPPLERNEIQSLVRQHGGQVHREIARFEKVMQDCERTPQEDDGLMTAFLVLSNCEPTASQE